jgi:2-iminobutanoate/2-iminopropanoate deaminase
MSKTAITSPELAPPVGPFSQAIEVGGFLYVSGQVGQDPATGRVVEGGIVAETERVFRNLSAVLKAAGRSFDHVARAAVYLTSMSDFAAMNGIYAKYFSQPFPARTTIAVAASRLEVTHGGSSCEVPISHRRCFQFNTIRRQSTRGSPWRSRHFDRGHAEDCSRI